MADRHGLIRGLDEAVREVLAYFEGAGRTSTAKIDKWQARDVLLLSVRLAQEARVQFASPPGRQPPLVAASIGLSLECVYAAANTAFLTA